MLFWDICIDKKAAQAMLYCLTQPLLCLKAFNTPCTCNNTLTISILEALEIIRNKQLMLLLYKTFAGIALRVLIQNVFLSSF